jgi:transcriptional regulator with XRE-family HTH domain
MTNKTINKNKKADTSAAQRLVAADRMLGARIKHYRERAGLTQQQLADAAMYKHYTSIGRIESGRDNLKMSMRRMLLIAAALGIEAVVLTRGLRL